MLSVATATVHRSMRAKPPTPSSSPDSLIVDTNLTWNAELTQSPKRRRSHQGSCSARKKLIPSPTEELPLKLNLNNAEITLTPIRKNVNKDESIRPDKIEEKDMDHMKNITPTAVSADKTNADDAFLLVEVHNNPKLIAINGENTSCQANSEDCSLLPFVNSDEISIRPIIKNVAQKRQHELNVSKSEISITETKSQQSRDNEIISKNELYQSKQLDNESNQILSKGNGNQMITRNQNGKTLKRMKLVSSEEQKPIGSNTKNGQNYILRSQTCKSAIQSPTACPDTDVHSNEAENPMTTTISTTSFYKKSSPTLRNAMTKPFIAPKNIIILQNPECVEIAANKSAPRKSVDNSLTAKITRAVEILSKNSSKNSIDVSPLGINNFTPQKPKTEVLSSSTKVSVLKNPIVPNLEKICTAQSKIELVDIPHELSEDWYAENTAANETVSTIGQSFETETLDEVVVLPDIDLKVTHHMTGFPNPPGENRCWLNATLQALFALPLFEALEQFNIQDCSNLTKLLNATKMHWMDGVNGRDKAYQTVKLLKMELGTLDETYPSECQQDVSEFLMILLNHIKLDLSKIISAEEKADEIENVPKNQQDPQNRVLKVPQTPSKRQPLAEISSPQNGSIAKNLSLGDQSQSPKCRKQILNHSVEDLLSPKVRKLSNPSDPTYKVHTPPLAPENNEVTTYKNPVEENFQLYLMEHYTCKGCEKQRQKKVDNLMLFVDIPSDDSMSPIDLQKAVEKIFAPEERHLTCGTCKHDVHTMRTMFRRRPNILTLQVNRYGMSSEGIFAKISSDVEIPKSLDLSATFSDELQTGLHTYEPICIIAHAGGTMDCGHYTSYVRHKDQWYHYNDMNVTPMTTEEALSAAQMTAYLIFFVKSISAEQDSG